MPTNTVLDVSSQVAWLLPSSWIIIWFAMCIFILYWFWINYIILIYMTVRIFTYCPGVSMKYSFGIKSTFRTFTTHLDGNPTFTSFAKQLIQVLLLVSGISASHNQHLVIFNFLLPPLTMPWFFEHHQANQSDILVLSDLISLCLVFLTLRCLIRQLSFSTPLTFWLWFFI